MFTRSMLSRAPLLVLLLAIIVAMVGGCMATNIGTRCRPRVQLLTPDGETFELNFGAGWALGSSASLVGLSPEATGLPSVNWVTDTVYHVPGALARDHTVEPRVLTITASVWTTDGTRAGLYKNLGELFDLARWDRGPSRASPSTLRVTVDGQAWDLDVLYQTAIESPQGRYGRNSVVGLRFLAPDPTWRSTTESSLTLDWVDQLTTNCIVAKIGGLWDPLGPPAAVGGIQAPFDMVIDPLTGDIYIAGDFLNWNNVANADYLARYRRATSTWEAVGDDGVGGPALNGYVNSLYFGPDRTLYVVGIFTNAGGAAHPNADYIAQVNPDTDGWDDVGNGPGVGVVTNVYDVVIGHDGTLYITGNFTNWNGLGSPAGDYVVRLPMPYAAGAWAVMGTGLNAVQGYCLAVLPDGNVVCGGSFTVAGGVADTDRIAEWDVTSTVWLPLDTGIDNGVVYDVAVGPDGTLYATGSFTTVSGETINRIASWNGTVWRDLDGGLDAQANRLAIDSDGMVYVGGSITTVGPLIVDSIARWNGYSWSAVDFDGPGAPSVVYAIATDGLDLYLGFNSTGTSILSGDNSVINIGSAPSYPVIEIKNQGLVRSIANETTGEEMLFTPMELFDGEIVEITTNKRTGRDITSTWRPLGRLGDLLPPGMGDWKLESGPRAAYGDVDGANLVTVFITDADPREHNDDNNQLSGWEDISGISQDNTDLGKLYASIVFDGGVNYHVDLYMDATRTELVGHTGTYNGAGAEPIIEDNDSGLGGTLTVDAVVGVDVDIFVYYTIVTATWYNRWWSLSEAIRDTVA